MPAIRSRFVLSFALALGASVVACSAVSIPDYGAQVAPEGAEPERDEVQARPVSASGASGGPLTFGFWGSAMSGVGRENYITSVADRGNVVFVSDDADDVVVARVAEAAQHGQRSILMVQRVFFPWASARLYPDYPTRFRALWAKLAPYRASVHGFYVFDEPFWRNDSYEAGKQVWAPFLRDALNEVSRFLHAEAPGLPTISQFAFVEVEWPQFYPELLPRDIDWIGVNCYMTEGDRCSEPNVRRIFQTMKAQKSPNQKIVLVPDAKIDKPADQPPSVTEDLERIARLRVYKDLADSNRAEVVAIFPFLFQNNHTATESLWGAESMPNLLGELKIYFQGLRGDVSCRGNDLVDKLGGVWPNAPVCAPQCEGSWLVRRDADGHQIASEQSPSCSTP